MLLPSLPSPHVEVLPAPLKFPTIVLGLALCRLRLIWEGFPFILLHSVWLLACICGSWFNIARDHR